MGAISKTGRELFRTGSLVATPGALEAFRESGDSALDYLHRHVRGDWGVVCPEDAKENDRSVTTNLRILSAYILSNSAKIWIITEADRSSTCILLPEEY